MNGVRPWSEYAREEWERMGICLDPDPRAVDEEPWYPPSYELTADRGSVVGLALLALAFAAGVVVGWWLA